MVETKKIKVKAGGRFNFYRNKVLGLPVKDFRALQAGREIEVLQSIVDNHPKAFEVIKKMEVKKNGD
jgi:glutathione peroxidase-family protein